MDANLKYGRRRKLGPPGRWLRCPRRSTIIADLFVALKTPLDSAYDDQVPEECRFYPSMALKVASSAKKSIGLWIDLTNTNRFYNKSLIEEAGVEYKKLSCRGFEECPSEQQVHQFISICKIYHKKCPDKIIAVHCTHGFNRTGFLIISFLVLEKNFGVDAALRLFATARPPGIYKQDYVNELFRQFENDAEPVAAGALPRWCFEEAEDEDDDVDSLESPSKQKKQRVSFVEDISGVEFVSDPNETKYVRSFCREMCSYDKKDFPGCQPVSLTMSNISYFDKKRYMVSWKADGTRYMMLIDGDKRSFLIGRDNNVFCAPDLTFICKNGGGPLTKTLVDGELVFDDCNGQRIPRYLIYDIVALKGRSVASMAFTDRQRLIEDELIGPRAAAISVGRIRREKEPFGIRLKPFFEMSVVTKVLAMKVNHEKDGLIFQPVDEPYVGGQCDSVLKWKPAELNSVDFRLEIKKETRAGLLRDYVGNLMVADSEHRFDCMQVTKELMRYDGQIVECALVNNEWKILRQRTDKKHPNSLATAYGIRRSVQFPVTERYLVERISGGGKNAPGPPQTTQPPAAV